MGLTKNPPKPVGDSPTSAIDLEVKDASLIFNGVWSEMVEEFGVEGLRFPDEVIWLNGAPGAGKGTQTRYIQEYREFTAEPIVVSSLLKSPEAKKLMDSGMMVGDREVTALIFRALIRPENSNGVVVDGFPRTKMQVLCLNMLHDKLNELSADHADGPLAGQFRKPMFHIVVLFVDEAESVTRQLFRGEKARAHNAEFEASGVGSAIEIRATDHTEEAARNRYRTFKEVTYESLKSLREVFFYHYINAHGSIEEVQQRIEDELRYQSSLELDQATFDLISHIPIAQRLSLHSRQDLVKRLDSYNAKHPELFQKAFGLIEKKFMPIIRKHAISGKAYVNSEDPMLGNAHVLAMIIDIFSDRGYHIVIDVRHYDVPKRIDRETFEIVTERKRVYRFILTFPGSEIRRGY